MNPIGIATADGRYLPGYRLATGEAVTMPGARSLAHYGAARDVAEVLLRALVRGAANRREATPRRDVSGADSAAADPGWTAGWDAARAHAAALLEDAPMLPTTEELALMVLEMAADRRAPPGSATVRLWTYCEEPARGRD